LVDIRRFQTLISLTSACLSSYPLPLSTTDSRSPMQSARCLHAIPNLVDSYSALSDEQRSATVAQLIFSETSTEASFGSIFSAYLTDTYWLCNNIANRDQKSLLATFQSHSSISSIKSVNELQCHSANVRADCASIFFYDIFLPHAADAWSVCCSKACVSTPDARGHSWRPSAVGKAYREFAVDHGTCHAFLYACTQIFQLILRPFDKGGSRELEGADHSFLCEEFGRKFWHQLVARQAWLDRVSLSPALFHGPPLLWRSCHHFPWPSNLGTSTRHWRLEFWDVRHLSSDLVPACFSFNSDPCQSRVRKFF